MYTLRLPDDLTKKIRRSAQNHRKSINSEIIDAITSWVEYIKQGPEPEVTYNDKEIVVVYKGVRIGIDAAD